MSERTIGDVPIEALLAELHEAGRAKGDTGMTVAEICAAVSHSPQWVQKLLQRARAEGRLKLGRRPYTRIDGSPATIPVYTVLKKTAKAIARTAKP